MKVVEIPNETIKVRQENGENTNESVFKQLLLTVNNNTPHKTETDAFLSKAIKERIEAHNGQSTIKFEESEITFLMNGIEKMRSQEKVVGPLWYHLIDPLRSAISEKEYERKHKKAETFKK